MNINTKLQTPLWDLKGYLDQVYEPSEDTFLLMDALEDNLSLIRNVKPLYILEIGSGSGIVITSLACLFKDSICTAIDINPQACSATANTALLNGTHVEVICGDLIECLKLNNMIDVLIFNPPYVPSILEEEKAIIDKAWAGNKDGRSATNRLFPYLKDLMSDKSVGFFVAIEENKPEEMVEILQFAGFEAEIVKKRKIIGEKLSIIRFIKNT